VYRVEDGRARSIRVDVSRDNGRSAQILDGIEPGQTIVLYPGEQIEDGTRVEQRP
jgi:HlyD family secretion protein